MRIALLDSKSDKSGTRAKIKNPFAIQILLRQKVGQEILGFRPRDEDILIKKDAKGKKIDMPDEIGYRIPFFQLRPQPVAQCKLYPRGSL